MALASLAACMAGSFVAPEKERPHDIPTHPGTIAFGLPELLVAARGPGHGVASWGDITGCTLPLAGTEEPGMGCQRVCTTGWVVTAPRGLGRREGIATASCG